MRMTSREEFSVTDALPLPASKLRDAQEGLDTSIPGSASIRICSDADETFLERRGAVAPDVALRVLKFSDIPRHPFPLHPPCSLPLQYPSERFVRNAWTIVGDNKSTKAMAAQARRAIDQYAWGRDALAFCQMSVDEFESLTGRIGWAAAGEVLLLAIARKCEDRMMKGERQARWVFRGNRKAGRP